MLKIIIVTRIRLGSEEEIGGMKLILRLDVREILERTR